MNDNNGIKRDLIKEIINIKEDIGNMKSDINNIDQKIEEIDKKVEDLLKFKWTIIGVITFLSFVFSVLIAIINIK